MLKHSLIAAAGLAALMAAGAARAAETDIVTTWSTTAQPGFTYDEGRYVRTEVVPHVMRRTDTASSISGGPVPGASRDEVGYVKSVEVPHAMPGATRHIESSTPQPGLTQDQGAYHGVK